MPAGEQALQSRSQSQDSTSGTEKSWLATTFKSSYDAEIALGNDLQRFLQQPDILELVPSEIKKHLDHWGDCGHIEGFGKLFNYLERNQAAADLRESIKDYFRAHRDLRGHLRNNSDSLV